MSCSTSLLSHVSPSWCPQLPSPELLQAGLHCDTRTHLGWSAGTQRLWGFLLVGTALPSIASFVFVLLTMEGLECRQRAEQGFCWFPGVVDPKM